MNNSEIFYGELMLILGDDLREFTRKFLDEVVPDYFYIVAASSTGKYHPWYSLGYGGLVRHTKAAVKIANDLLSLEQYRSLPRDEIIAALILHDTFKHGKTFAKYTDFAHPLIAADSLLKSELYKLANPDLQKCITLIAGLIRSHMGQWNSVDGKIMMPKPNSEAEKFVHMCDYLASRKYVIVEVN